MTDITAKAEVIRQFKRMGIPYIAEVPWAAATDSLIQPKTRLEPMPAWISGTHHSDILIDIFDPNPGPAFIRRVMPGAQFVGPEPTMFANGDLPSFTASGIEPAQLRLVRWELRYAAAAYTPSRVVALMCIEEGDDLPQRLQTDEGRGALSDYFLRVKRWAVEAPPQPGLNDAEYASLFPSGNSQDG